jgi:vacuolar-type H+-ATPase subunit I/STV1
VEVIASLLVKNKLSLLITAGLIPVYNEKLMGSFQYRLMKGEWKLDKENQEVARDGLLLVSITLQKEERIRQTVEREKKQKEEELALLVDQIKQLSIENEKEKFHLEELERALANEKNRRKVERKWAETQAEYKLCLEKMIEDTMHQ